MDEVIAKKRKKDKKTQTLDEHTFNVIGEALQLINDDELKFVAKETGVEEEKIKDLIFFCAYFHDIGKATYEFKKTIDDDSDSYHSLYSSSLFTEIKEFEIDEQTGINMLMLCILTHHSIFKDKSLFKAAGHDKRFKFKFLPSAETFFGNYKEVYTKYLNKECNYEFKYKEVDLKKLEEKIKLIYEDVKCLEKYKEKIGLRLLYAYVSGVLNLSDWIASAKFNETMPKIKFDYLISKEDLCKRFAKSIKIHNFTPKGFQEQLSNCKGSVLVEIPTGEGKTEGSFLWAINNIKSVGDKIIYTLPTQTTSNKLYERARDVFYDDTGLIHSSSKLYLQKKYEVENGAVDDNFESDVLFSTTFNKGVTVSTIDSLFKYFLNIGRYNIAMLNFMRSVIIIDEVHSYDLKLMGFMKRFLELCQDYNVPVCLMSASIPNKIKEHLNINKLPTITDKNLFDKKANYTVKVDDSLENHLDKIVDSFNNGKNILVVRNNIKNSISTFKALKKDKRIENIVLYNSQFKKKDRVEKEEEIYRKLEDKEHFILVATQVVEISLDIDFDVMFTDNAPIDSLIQRFGRVNRSKRVDKIGEIYIYKDTDITPYYYRMLEITYETIKDGIFTLGTYTEWLNTVYNKLFEDKKIIGDLEKEFKEGYEKFNENIKALNGIYQSDDLYDLRDIKYIKNDFILVEDHENRDYDYGNTVSLPFYLSQRGYLHLSKNYSRGIYYDVLNIDYDYEVGAIIEGDRLIY